MIDGEEYIFIGNFLKGYEVEYIDSLSNKSCSYMMVYGVFFNFNYIDKMWEIIIGLFVIFK